MKIEWNIGVETPITPAEALPPMPDMQGATLLVITGRAPIWRYGMALVAAMEALDMRVGITTFDPRLGIVVVRGGIDYRVGQVIE